MEIPEGTPPSSVRPQRTACRDGEESGGQDPALREGGPPPNQARTPFVRGLIQEMGGHPQDLSRPPPNARRSEGAGVGGMSRELPRPGEEVGAPSPLGGRGAPEEQARAIVARIISTPPGGVPHSGQTPALQQAQQIRGARVQGGRGRRGGRGYGDRWRRGVGEGEGSTRHPPAEPPAGKERANRPEERAIRPETERRRRSRIPKGQKKGEEGMEIPHGGGV